jgi:methionyl-tRNA formyltransferase
MTNPFKVVFMGTPDFAVPALAAIKEYGCNVPLVVTQPDKPKGRGRKLTPPPVKIAATEFDFPVIQPDSVKTDGFYQKLVEISPDLLVVVAFGHVLPKKILGIPGLGSINVHASLLPKYRGPAPIQWAIINGDIETGVTTMLMDDGLDTGQILLTKKTPVFLDDTAETLHNRLAGLGAEVLKNTLEALHTHSIQPVPQNHALATYAPMLTKNHGRIDWSLSAAYIERFIRGMTPWPGAHTFLEEKRLRIFRAEIRPRDDRDIPGRVLDSAPNELWVATGDGILSIKELQGASGKRMPVGDFLRGFTIPAGMMLR